MRKVLVIDGNYFANRCLGGLNMGDRMNNLETSNEQQAFLSALNNGLYTLYDEFKPYVQNLIFCCDNSSWRKKVTPFRPYYIAEDSNVPIGYKENRKDKKEKSPINYDNFYSLFREFVESLKSNIIVFDIPGLEGDDLIMLLGQVAALNPELLELIVFCTDGDMHQTVRDNVMLMRNIKSGDCPYGEFVISYSKYCKIFEGDVKSQLLNSNIDNTFYKQLFGMSINGPKSVERSLNEGIVIATPIKLALIKSICGDKKDNIFPLFRWLASTGSKSFSVTENHIIKALDKFDIKLTETACRQILGDKELIRKLLEQLKIITKQKDVNTEFLLSHLRHNMRMNILSKTHLSEDLIKSFDICFKVNKNNIFNGVFDENQAKTLQKTSKDNARNLLEQSIPDFDDLLK